MLSNSGSFALKLKNQRKCNTGSKKNMGDIGFCWGWKKNAGYVYMAKIDFARMILWVCLLFQVYKGHICVCVPFVPLLRISTQETAILGM